MRTSILRGVLGLAACTGLAGLAAAQQPTLFQLDVNQSNFTWSGTTSVGSITPSPANFQVDGTIGSNLWGGGQPVGQGEFDGTGTATLVPNTLNGSIGFVASLQLEDLEFVISAAPFAVDAAGNFTATITGTATNGTMTVTPLIGSPTVQNLTGLSSVPSAASGSIVTSGMNHVLTLPVTATFPFNDPNTGISGSVTLQGTAVALGANPTPSTYCASNPNTTGVPGEIGWTGTTSLWANDLQLTGTNLPANKNGTFFLGTTQVQTPFSNGFLCTSSNVVRLGVTNTGPTGSLTQAFDNAVVPGLQVGSVRHFQFWHRDAGSNLTNALTVTFAP